MIQRYDFYIQPEHSGIEAIPGSTGAWVKWDDVKHLTGTYPPLDCDNAFSLLREFTMWWHKWNNSNEPDNVEDPPIGAVEELLDKMEIVWRDTNWTVEKKDIIEGMLIGMWQAMGMDVPSNYEKIVQYCYEDVCETADPATWDSGDVAIAFRRWIEDH